MDLKLLKTEVYNILKTVKVNNISIKALQEQTDNPAEIPCTTYSNMKGTPTYCINNVLAKEMISVIVDCWHKTSATNTTLFTEMSKKMNAQGWHCLENIDEGKINGKYKIMSRWIKEIYE